MNTDETTTETTDDTEGHAMRPGRIYRPGRNATPDDTEGHMPRIRGNVEQATEDDTIDDDADDADTEGHGMRGRWLDGADEGGLVGDADTEGHATGRFLDEADEGDLVGDDDTEGHAFRAGKAARPGRNAPTEDTEGHMPRIGSRRDQATEDDTIDDDADDDAEGHAMRGRGLDDPDEGDLVGDADTEGHAARGKALDGAGEGDLVGDADTEGHLYIPKDERTGGSEPMAMRGKVAPAGEDDTEGHGRRNP